MVDTGATIEAARFGVRRRGVRKRRVIAPRVRGVTGFERVKRASDIVGAALLLLLLSPVLLATWIAVRATSSGPGLYWSQRVGRHGRLFWMPKLRTMAADAPLRAREALASAECRITPIGHLLRRFAIDELPQLVCILTGKMSFVGPRPLLPNDPGSEARRRFPASLSLRPGLSGLAQVAGRNRLSCRRKARLDAFYARTASPMMDADIVARTFAVVLNGKGYI